MFKDESFKDKAAVDRYGRKVPKKAKQASSELERLYTFLFELNAWYQLDACLTMQQVTALSFYFFYRLALPHEIVLAVLGILATCSWIVGAALAIEREWTSWWYRAGLVGLIQPAFLPRKNK